MKTEIKTELGDPKYPCFKKHKILNCIVLFTGEKTGTLVHRANAACEQGHYCKSWHEADYEPWFGTITVIP